MLENHPIISISPDVLVENVPNVVPHKRRIPPASMASKVKIFGDIVSPIVDEEDWQCLK